MVADMEILGDYTTSLVKALEEIDPDFMDYNALVIAGSHTPKEPEQIIKKIKQYRENELPIYAECYGHQLCAIEYARNILGITDATSEEFGTGTLVVKKRPELKVGLHGGESYWNNYEVVIDFYKPKNMITAQYHASYQSSKQNPHPLLVKFIKLCKSK